MRTLLLTLFASLALVARTRADDEEPQPTKFNGLEVPVMTELNSANVDEEIKKGNWLLEFYSPSCPHCMQMKPVYQTAYEFYYTSNPVPGNEQKKEDNLNSFSRFYDVKFAKLNCQAFGDACSKHGVNGWPTLKLYRDGEEIKQHKGAMAMDKLGNFIEECLETLRPGSRPLAGLKFPEVGADHAPESSKPEVSAEKDKNPAAGSAAASAHNAIATEAGADKESQAVSDEKATKKPEGPIPNAEGSSIVLDAEKFQTLITNTHESWFVKFYAPWCHHCQAMKPNWDQMAKDMKGKLNVGEVNCDAEKRLCRDAGVKGYPTMLFFRGGERVEYEGLRGVGDLIAYAKTSTEISKGVQDVTFDQFAEMEKSEEVIFVFFYDHATTSEDFEAMERQTLGLVGHAKLVKTNDPKLVERYKIYTWPRLIVSRDTKPTYYQPLAPKDIRDVQKVSTWMQSNWLPIVPELTSSNAQEIMENSIVVLTILNRENQDEYTTAKRELKNAAIEWIDWETHHMQMEREELRNAKQLRVEEAEDRGDERAISDAKRIRINMDEVMRQKVSFAWVDGVFWERWIKTTYGIDVHDGARVIINDQENHQYWDTTISGDLIRPSRTSILETLRSVTATPSRISAKSTSSPIMATFYKLRKMFFGHPIMMISVFIAVIILVGLFGRRGIRRGRSFGDTGGFFNLNEKGGMLNGGGPGGKKD